VKVCLLFGALVFVCLSVCVCLSVSVCVRLFFVCERVSSCRVSDCVATEGTWAAAAAADEDECSVKYEKDDRKKKKKNAQEKTTTTTISYEGDESREITR